MPKFLTNIDLTKKDLGILLSKVGSRAEGVLTDSAVEAVAAISRFSLGNPALFAGTIEMLNRGDISLFFVKGVKKVVEKDGQITNVVTAPSVLMKAKRRKSEVSIEVAQGSRWSETSQGRINWLPGSEYTDVESGDTWKVVEEAGKSDMQL